jgi:hypothetical protein
MAVGLVSPARFLASNDDDDEDSGFRHGNYNC